MPCHALLCFVFPKFLIDDPLNEDAQHESVDWRMHGVLEEGIATNEVHAIEKKVQTQGEYLMCFAFSFPQLRCLVTVKSTQAGYL